MRLLTKIDFSSFLMEKPAAVVHFDAAWDGSRRVMRLKMEEAEKSCMQAVNFGEVDCDLDPDLARSIPVLNVPCIAYYRDGKLVGTIVGQDQNFQLFLSRVIRGEPLQTE